MCHPFIPICQSCICSSAEFEFRAYFVFSFPLCVLLPIPSLVSFSYCDCTFNPIKNIDIGFGRGQNYSGSIYGGEVGFVLDGRGRNISFHADDTERINQILNWSESTNEYNKEQPDV